MVSDNLDFFYDEQCLTMHSLRGSGMGATSTFVLGLRQWMSVDSRLWTY